MDKLVLAMGGLSTILVLCGAMAVYHAGAFNINSRWRLCHEFVIDTKELPQVEPLKEGGVRITITGQRTLMCLEQ